MIWWHDTPLNQNLVSRSQQMGRVPPQCRHRLWWIHDTCWMVWLVAPQDWQAPNWGEIQYTAFRTFYHYIFVCWTRLLYFVILLYLIWDARLIDYRLYIYLLMFQIEWVITCFLLTDFLCLFFFFFYLCR